MVGSRKESNMGHITDQYGPYYYLIRLIIPISPIKTYKLQKPYCHKEKSRCSPRFPFLGETEGLSY